jgi:hypothetical protein
MPIRPRLACVATLTLAAALCACSPKTKLLESWAAPGFQRESVKKILVLGVAPDSALRRLFEETFAADLQKRGYEAIPGYRWVADPAKLDKDALQGRMLAEGVTHVLVTRVTNKTRVETYHPPTVATVGVSPYGPGWYGGWGSYYAVGYTTVTSPGYVSSSDVVNLETNFYAAGADELLWSGLSETWVEGSGAENVRPVIDAVVYAMRAQRIL